MRIAELARAAGVGVETVRYYERHGLVPLPSRVGGSYRVYGADHLLRLHFIRRAKGLGFTIAEIGELLGLRDDEVTSCAEVGRRATAKLVDLDRRLRELAAIRAALARLAASCGAAAPGTCALLHHLGEDSTDE